MEGRCCHVACACSSPFSAGPGRGGLIRIRWEGIWRCGIAMALHRWDIAAIMELCLPLADAHLGDGDGLRILVAENELPSEFRRGDPRASAP